MTDYSPASFASSSRALWSEGAAISAAHIEALERRWRTASDGQNVTEDYLKAELGHSVTYASVSTTGTKNSTFPEVRGITGFVTWPEFCDMSGCWIVGIKPDLTSLHLTIKANLSTLFLSHLPNLQKRTFTGTRFQTKLSLWRSFQSCCTLPGEYDLSASTLTIHLQMSV